MWQIFEKWTGAYRFMAVLVVVGRFTSLFYGKIDGMNFVAALLGTLGLFYGGGMATKPQPPQAPDTPKE